MGFMSRRVVPVVCGKMCVCCPALRSRSRHPVKRYKKLLADIFPKSPPPPTTTDVVDARKIVKLCEYAANNPFRIPKIAQHLQHRISKELLLLLRNHHQHHHLIFITVAMEAYNKFLCICKHHMPYFAASLLNVVVQLLDNTTNSNQHHLSILGCRTLTSFIYSQADGTYARNIEILVPKVCMMAREAGDEHSQCCLRASSLQCISSMVWFMAEFSHFFTGFDDIVHVTLDNYEPDVGHVDGNESGEAHHNWVADVIRSEARGAVSDVSASYTIIRPHSEKKDPSLLTREEIETPKVWAQICIQKMAELAKESTTMRRVLDPMFIYFDIRRHWAPQQAFTTAVLSDMFYFMEGSGNEQSIVSAIIRHLDHKNVAHDPQVKSNIIRIAATLARQFRSEAMVVETGIVSDLCRHLRKSLQATVALTGEQELNLNILLQNTIEDCLLEMAKWVGDAQPLFNMITLTLEKPIPVGVAARATIGSMLILTHIISLASSGSHSQQVFPEALLLQLLKTMVHPDAEARIVAHQIFSVLIVPNYNQPKHELISFRSDHSYESMRSQPKSGPVFASAAALLEKLRRKKDGVKVEKHGDDDAQYEYKEKERLGEEWRQLWIRKNSPTFCKISSIIDRRAGLTVSADTEPNIIKLSEDQIAQLLSAFWIQACLPDNMPSNFEAISHSFNLTLISSHLRNPNDHVVRFFQLSLSLRNISLDPKYEMLPPSCQRSLFVLAAAMMMSTSRIYHIPDLYDILKSSISYDVDPYLGIGDDQQLYVKFETGVEEYRSTTDHQAALCVLSELREGVNDSDKAILDILVRSLTSIMELDKDDLTMQLSETFKLDGSFLFCPQSLPDGDCLQTLSIPKESLSFDGDFLASGSIEDDAISESSVANLSRFITQVSTSPSLSHVISVGKLLELALEKAGQVAGTAISSSPLPYSTMTSQCEALGSCTRKKLSNWLDHDLKSTDKILLTSPADGLSMIRKISSDIGPRQESGGLLTEPWLTMRLPPASPFDNFLKAVNRKEPLISSRGRDSPVIVV